ncbi:DUF4359 domain-containing protein [Flavobacterium sp. H4147]|uniref:DUF4359 domain-containing protein n=1 Tax=Flavobacterium sp. H4147 TaxID=3034149 RepID=UPI0023EAE051|nr:DUF4359 domain-containing protein [Flavobacterium sp. H4147]
MKTKHYLIIGFLLFVIIAALTNPETDKHKEEVKLKMNTFLEKENNKINNNDNDQWAKAGNVLAQSMINMMVDNMVSSSNYIIFSTTNVTYEGKTKTIGVGFLGNVFLSSKIDEAIKNK